MGMYFRKGLNMCSAIMEDTILKIGSVILPATEIIMVQHLAVIDKVCNNIFCYMCAVLCDCILFSLRLLALSYKKNKVKFGCWLGQLNVSDGPCDLVVLYNNYYA